jgi:hypothetical protein
LSSPQPEIAVVFQGTFAEHAARPERMRLGFCAYCEHFVRVHAMLHARNPRGFFEYSFSELLRLREPFLNTSNAGTPPLGTAPVASSDITPRFGDGHLVGSTRAFLTMPALIAT